MVALTLWLGWAAPVRALDPAVRLGAYHHDIWTGEQGAPREIDAMAQTLDGWIWLGTTSGLVRFDGVRFEAFQPADGHSLLGKGITALAPHPNGDLWIGYTFGGLSVLREGRLHHLSPVAGNPVGATYSIAFERDGSAWVAATTGLFHVRDGVLTRMGAAQNYPMARAEYVYRDHYDRLWASDGVALYLLDRASGRFAPLFPVRHNPLILGSPDGRVWILDDGRVRLLPEPAGGWRPAPARALAGSSFQTLFDRDGNFWKGNCPVGLCRAFPASWQANEKQFPDRVGDERLDQSWQMSSLNVHSMMEDREGNIWVGTVAGLERFRHNKLIRLPFPSDAERLGLAHDGGGTIWAATQSPGDIARLWRVDDGAMRLVPTDQNAYVVTAAGDGTVLVGGNRRIERRRGDQLLESIPLPPVLPGQNKRNYVILVVQDHDSLWVGIGGRGLYRWHGGKWLPPEAHPQLKGLLFATADARGRTWFGLRNNRVVLRDGEDWREYGERDGIALGGVRFIDARGEVLLSGDNGMAVLRDGRFRPIVPEQADTLSNVSGIALTADGDRWLNTSRGLLRVRAADWSASMRDAAVPLRASLWNEVEGYPGSAETVVRMPSAFTAPDGKVWLAGTDGAAWFDPARLRANALAPLVEIQAIHAGGRRHLPGGIAAFAPGTERLQIDYTALSYTMPERVSFRYRLVGLDQGWQEVGARRVAYYTNLGPGSYRFEVEAMNEDGVASGVAATAPFEIRPRFVQTRAFAALCVALAALAVFLLVRLRLAQVRRQLQARLEERFNERERIARTLHDTFLQSLQGLILRLQALALRLEPGSEARKQLDSALDLADKVVLEGRDQVMDLRVAADAPTLAQALADAAALLKEGSTVRVALRTEGNCVQLPCALHDEVYHIAREAIANAVRHARAELIEIDLACHGGQMVLAVRDDGIGLDPLVQMHGRPGHWGLTGMRERAARIGGRLVIRNRPARGAEVVLTLQADAAGSQRAAARETAGVA
ncbi:sensor histidine kinase [Massilia sp. DD77]|uniref:sensor histidine kinase n=1 Tax=Massilia sp. DD77 TaxID=3109349 RepID=UPI003000F4E9